LFVSYLYKIMFFLNMHIFRRQRTKRSLGSEELHFVQEQESKFELIVE
jgi:hypothetical protein